MSLKILMGPMFAGKSTAILRLTNRYKSIGWPILLLTYAADNRYSTDELLMTHDLWEVSCKKVSALMPEVTTKQFEDAKLIIIDEAQFFGDLKAFVLHVVDALGKDVVLVGLDGDADRKPFGQLLDCVPLADEVEKLSALCKRCGDGTPALFTHCRQSKTEQVCVGGAEMFESLCRKHFNESYRDAPSPA